MIRPVPRQPIRFGGGPPAAELPSVPTTEELWRISFDSKVAQLAQETIRTSTLVRAMHAAGHRSYAAHRGCVECRALAEIGVIDPRADTKETTTDG